MPCVSYNEEQLFQASNMPRSLMTNLNDFEYQLCQGSYMLSLNYENINDVISQILKLSCVSFRYVSISYVLATWCSGVERKLGTPLELEQKYTLLNINNNNFFYRSDFYSIC